MLQDDFDLNSSKCCIRTTECCATSTFFTTAAATKDLRTLPAVSRNATSSTSFISGSPKAQNVENAILSNLATYNNIILPKTTRNTYLDTENPSDDLSVPYVVYKDPQIVPRSNQSNPENHHYPHTLIPENTMSDTQKDKSTVLPAHYDTQRFNTAPRTSPFATPSPTIIIHAQTVVIGSTVPSHTPTQDSSDNKHTAFPKRSTRNLEEECQAPAPLTTPSIPPRDLSGLRSRHQHPFSSLQRRS